MEQQVVDALLIGPCSMTELTSICRDTTSAHNVINRLRAKKFIIAQNSTGPESNFTLIEHPLGETDPTKFSLKAGADKGDSRIYSVERYVPYSKTSKSTKAGRSLPEVLRRIADELEAGDMMRHAIPSKRTKKLTIELVGD